MNETTNNIFNVPAKAEQNWTSKKELAEICSCDVRTITNVVDDLSKENDFLTQSHIKKGVLWKQ